MLLKYYLILFLKRFLWIHYLILVSLFFAGAEIKSFLLFVLLANIFIQQFKLFSDFKDVVILCKLYQKPIYFIAIFNLIVASFLLVVFKEIVPSTLIFAILLPGFTFNIFKTVLNAHRNKKS